MHFRSLINIIVLFGSFLLVVHCSQKDEIIPQTENETFNQLLKEAPATIIDLDGISVDTVIIGYENTLGSENSSWFSEPVYLDFPATSLIKVDDTLYVANQEKIYLMGKDGAWQRSVGREGRGPAEFAASFKIANNSNYIMAFDYWNGRIQVFDHNLNLLFIINKNLHDSLIWKNYALSDNHLYLELNSNSNNHILAAYRADELENQIETFWPKIIPNGLQPAPYNGIIIDVNNDENIAITNFGLPYLFLLNPERDIEHILYFESSYYRQSENPSAEPVKVEGNTERDLPGVRNFIKYVRIMDDDSIYFVVWNNLYQIISEGSNKYRLQKAWHFIHADPHLREEYPKGIDISSMIIEDGTLYFISLMGGYVFRVKLA